MIAGSLAATVTAALAACAGPGSDHPSATARPRHTRTPLPTPDADRGAVPHPTGTATPGHTLDRRPTLVRQARPAGTLTGLPAGTPGIAWTVDDGVDSAVVEAYARFAAATGVRITFFLNGVNPSWTEHADLLRPLVASGQVQLGNHTWDHPDLRRLSDDQIATELMRNHDFIEQTYGVDARPYFRPPFGFHDARVDAAAARVGYTAPTLWYGSLGDSGPLNADQILALATQWFLPAHIVIGHANHPGTIDALPRLHTLLQARKLPTWTLDDVWTR